MQENIYDCTWPWSVLYIVEMITTFCTYWYLIWKCCFNKRQINVQYFAQHSIMTLFHGWSKSSMFIFLHHKSWHWTGRVERHLWFWRSSCILRWESHPLSGLWMLSQPGPCWNNDDLDYSLNHATSCNVHAFFDVWNSFANNF